MKDQQASPAQAAFTVIALLVWAYGLAIVIGSLA